MESANNTSVHTEETSAFQNIPHNYQEYRRRYCESEWLQTEKLYSHIDSIDNKSRSEKLRDCRKFAWFARNNETGKVRVLSNACRLRWCPICSNAKTKHLTVEVSEWLKHVKNPKFSTFTMKHTSAPLSEQIKWLYEHFRLFRQRKSIQKYFHGGVWFFQLKKSKSTDEWHPHLHCILDSKFIPQELLSNEWQIQTHSSKIVDIRAVYKPEKVAEYVARYCSRPAKLEDYSMNDAIEIFTVFHGKRLCGTWGTGRTVSLRPHKISSEETWKSIGSWTNVVTQKESLPRARAIIEAWISGAPIIDGIYVGKKSSDSDRYIDGSMASIGVEDFIGRIEGFI
jgi:hypothetical protein